MTMPSQRQRDPVPWSRGGEVALVAIAAVLLALALAALLGLALASACFGGGWVWPHGADTIGRVLGGLLSGHPGRGHHDVGVADMGREVTVRDPPDRRGDRRDDARAAVDPPR